MAGLGRGGRGQALLEALKQPVRRPGTQSQEGSSPSSLPQQPQVQRLVLVQSGIIICVIFRLVEVLSSSLLKPHLLKLHLPSLC